MAGSVYQRGELYWIKFYYKGKKYEKSAKTTRKREAQDLLAFYMGQVVRGEFKGFEENSLSMRELFDAFHKDCERRKLRGIDIIGYHLKPLCAWFERMDADQVSERDINRYINHRLDQGRSTTTVNRELQYLGQTLRLAKRRKLIKEVPYIEKFSEKDNARQGFFEGEDFERFVSFLPEDLKVDVWFGYLTGWRKGEIAHLAWEHIEERVRIRLPPHISKNKDGRVLSADWTVGCRDHRAATCCERDDIPWVFFRDTGQPIRSFVRSWKTASKKAGLPVAVDKNKRKTFHALRRTSARDLSVPVSLIGSLCN